MEIEFDADKGRANLAKHGVSPARAADLEILADVRDERLAENRRRVYGPIDGLPHCLAYTRRGSVIRAISLRRTHLKEFRRHVR